MSLSETQYVGLNESSGFDTFLKVNGHYHGGTLQVVVYHPEAPFAVLDGYVRRNLLGSEYLASHNIFIQRAVQGFYLHNQIGCLFIGIDGDFAKLEDANERKVYELVSIEKIKSNGAQLFDSSMNKAL